MVVVGALVLAALAWAFVFRLPASGVWPRTWVAAVVLSACSVATSASGGHLGGLLGAVDPTSIAVGLAVGVGWLVATHLGHAVLDRALPGFGAQVSRLYSLQTGDRVATMVGPVIAMGVAEELLFRGTLQGRIGLLGALTAYTAVQVVTGNWALVLAGALCGAVWGTLRWWQGGLLAPLLAHVVWTTSLTFLWPLGGRGVHGVGTPDVVTEACDGSPPGGGVADPAAG